MQCCVPTRHCFDADGVAKGNSNTVSPFFLSFVQTAVTLACKSPDPTVLEVFFLGPGLTWNNLRKNGWLNTSLELLRY